MNSDGLELTGSSTICAGSSILLLAQVSLDSKQTLSPRQSSHVRQKSDELIEDLEIQLGSSQIPYMQIRVSYAHSAFPKYSQANTDTGLWSMRSRMETTATAALKRHNTSSIWSPRPSPAPDPLLPLIERHWGADKARNAMQQILTLRPTPRKAVKAGLDMPLDTNNTHHELRTLRSYTIPPVPKRQTSLQKLLTKTSLLRKKGSAEEQRRRVLSRGKSSLEAEAVKEPTYDTSSSCGSLSSNAWQTDVSPSEHSGSPGSKRRPLGTEGLKGLMPKLSDFSLDGRSVREKAPGKWSWVNWF